MKKWLIAGLFMLIAAYIYAATETHNEDEKGGQQRYSRFQKISVDFTEAELDAGVTEALDPVYGFVYRIVIDSNGTDTSWSLTLRDESDITIFTNTALTSASEPNSYAIYEDDTEGNPWNGVPVGGIMDLVVANGAGLDDLDVHIYVISYWK